MTKAFTAYTGIGCIQCKEFILHRRTSEDLVFYMKDEALAYGTTHKDWTYALCLDCDIYQQGLAYDNEEVKRSAYMGLALGSSFCPPELARAEAYLQLAEGIPHELEDTDARGASEASPLLAPASHPAEEEA